MKKYLVGTVAGIGIFVHWTFLVMLAGLFVFYLYNGASVAAALAGIALITTFFGCVVLHELGHALMARRFNIQTLDITMYPIGGVARLLGMPREPRQEFLIAVAGPAVNLAIAAVLFVVNLFTSRPLTLGGIVEAETNVLGMLMWLNMGLVAFNMLPAFPMDGGRVFRAWLATWMPYGRATRVASYVGQGMAALFGLYAIVSFQLVLLFVAVFVFVAARQEAAQVLAEDQEAESSEREA